MVAALPLHFQPPVRRSATRRAAAGVEPVGGDLRFPIHGVSWAQYVALNDALGERSGVRVCYCEGTLELMSPGLLHEDKKTTIARLLELYALAHDLPLYGAGSMTYRKKPKERGAEPDECYYLGKATQRNPPHLAIEVAVSRSAIDKLSLYAGLGVLELWIWRDDRIDVFHLGAKGYRRATRSKLLPDLDIEELSAFVRRNDQVAAARAYWKKLQKKPNRTR